MTSSVKFTAHCSGSKRLYVCTTRVDHTGTQRKSEDWLQDGESMEVTVYDSARAHAFEVDASMVPADYVPNPQIIDLHKVPPPEAVDVPPDPGTNVNPTSDDRYTAAVIETTNAAAEAVQELGSGGAFSGAGASAGWDEPAPGFDSPAADSASGD